MNELAELTSVGPATLDDLAMLGIDSIEALAERDAREMYDELCELRGARLDRCCEDVFRAAVAQARDPELPDEQRQWWYWSRKRRALDAT